MPNKITDDEIIKALECCVKITTDCEKCPYWGISKVENCFDVAKQDAVDLINRQKAEIESLKYDYDNLQRQFDEIYQQFHYLSNVEIPYLYSFTEDKDKKLETIANILLRAKAEAVKEFAERLKQKVDGEDTVNTYWLYGYIGYLLKEMVGEDK